MIDTRNAKRVSGLILTLGLLLAAPGLLGVKVFAQYPDRDRYYDDDDYYRRGGEFTEADARRVGAVNGYDVGYQRGSEDSRYRGRTYDFERDRVYKDATLGYRSEYRHKDNYKKGFRFGYEQGYNDAISGHGNRGRTGRNGRRHGIEYNGPFGRIRF